MQVKDRRNFTAGIVCSLVAVWLGSALLNALFNPDSIQTEDASGTSMLFVTMIIVVMFVGAVVAALVFFQSSQRKPPA